MGARRPDPAGASAASAALAASAASVATEATAAAQTPAERRAGAAGRPAGLSGRPKLKFTAAWEGAECAPDAPTSSRLSACPLVRSPGPPFVRLSVRPSQVSCLSVAPLCTFGRPRASGPLDALPVPACADKRVLGERSSSRPSASTRAPEIGSSGRRDQIEFLPRPIQSGRAKASLLWARSSLARPHVRRPPGRPLSVLFWAHLGGAACTRTHGREHLYRRRTR